MSWYVHEVEIRFANQLDLGRIEKAVMILTHESSVVYSFLGKFPHIRFGAYYTHVVRFNGLLLVCKGDVLTYQHSYAYSRHVESIQKRLDVVINLHPLPFPFVFEYALRNSGDYTVMPPLNSFQGSGEALVVIVEFRRPISLIICRSIVPPRRTFASAIAITVRLLRPVLALFDTRIVCSLA